MTKKIDIVNKKNSYIKDCDFQFEDKKSTYARIAFTKGEMVLTGIPQYELSKNTMHSLYIDWNKIVIFQDEILCIAHSCDPNLVIKNNEYGGYSWYAFKNIVVDEMLTWNYTTIENNISSIDNCLCGSHNCVGKLLNLNQFMNTSYYKYHAKYLDTPKKISSTFVFKLVIVIGATSQLGTEICLFLEKKGLYIVAIDQEEEKLDLLKIKIKKNNGIIRTYCTDITSIKNIEKVFDNTNKHFGQIDVVINNTETIIYNDIFNNNNIINNNSNQVIIINKLLDSGKEDSKGEKIYCQNNNFIVDISKL